jgi:transcriptional antiterminator RfaH
MNNPSRRFFPAWRSIRANTPNLRVGCPIQSANWSEVFWQQTRDYFPPDEVCGERFWSTAHFGNRSKCEEKMVQRTMCGALTIESDAAAILKTTELDPVWCCIRSHPKREHIAAAQLSCVPGVEVFNPQLRLERRTRRGPMYCTESLFVNYLFARFVPQITLEKVRYTPSVKTVLQFGAEVSTIPAEVIEDLRRTVAENAGTVFTDAPQAGEEVEVSAGPFQGERGIVARVLPARQRVELLLDVMGRPLPAEFSFSSIIFKRKSMANRVLRTDASHCEGGAHAGTSGCP